MGLPSPWLPFPSLVYLLFRQRVSEPARVFIGACYLWPVTGSSVKYKTYVERPDKWDEADGCEIKINLNPRKLIKVNE